MRAVSPTAPRSFLLVNENGRFVDRTPDLLSEIGMVTDIRIYDMDGDKRPEVLLTGEWMGLVILKKEEDKWSVVNTGTLYS